MGLDLTMSQWVDLGILSKACMVRPSACTSGGFIALWLRITSRDGNINGIISSSSGAGVESLYVSNKDNEIS